MSIGQFFKGVVTDVLEDLLRKTSTRKRSKRSKKQTDRSKTTHSRPKAKRSA